MIKFDWNNENSIKILSIVLSLTCALVMCVIMIITKVMISNDAHENIITVEVANVNSAKAQDIGSYRVEVLDYGKLSYYIKVNCKNQVVTVYTMDENGEYSIPIKKMICSTGIATPRHGVYEISDKYEWRSLVGNVYGQYATRITGQILFHSVPYTRKDKSTLEYWEYDKLGQPASKGCVRLTVEDSKWIYDYCKPGTKVEFFSEGSENATSDISPVKLSEYDDQLRGWDPTDPDENNPWLNQNK